MAGASHESISWLGNFPKSIYDIAMIVKEEYGNIPWFISENGMGVENEARFIDENGVIDDVYRIEFYEEHLRWLHKAIEEEVTVLDTTLGPHLIAGLGIMHIRIVTDLSPLI